MAGNRYITPQQLEQALLTPDLTDPFEAHAVGMTAELVLKRLQHRGWPAAVPLRGPKVVSPQDNYGLLGYSREALILDSEQARWVDSQKLLRTHTSCLLPAALRAAAAKRWPGETLLLAAPGITFRRDVRDRWHCTEPHQMDVWVLGGPQLSSRQQLMRLVGDILEGTIPGARWLHRERPSAYTDRGVEINVIRDDRAIEVMAGGCIARSLLEHLGIDPARHGGLALSLGLDRLTMLCKGIPDIRLLRDPDERAAAQMHDLLPWRPLPRLPAITRELSVAMAAGHSLEVLTERILQAAGACASWVEEITLRGRWPISELPQAAIEQLGVVPGQENLLLRITLRDATQPLAVEQANALYDVLEDALHEGMPGGSYRLER